MKKLLLTVLVAGAAATLASCGPSYDATVLADADHLVSVVGAHEIKVDGEWKANEWKINANNAMTATSVLEVSKISTDVANALNKKQLKNLYMAEVRFGAYAAGWTTRARIGDKNYVGDGSFTVKSIYGSYDEETKTYISDQWVSDPKTAYVESLTPSTLFYPTWQEEKDENGFAWDQNPVCIGGAGVYTYILAQYKNASAEGKPGYGAALVLKEAYTGEGAQKLEEEVTFVLKDHTYGIIGGFADNNWASDVVALSKEDDNTFSVSYKFDAGVSWKIRADGKWDKSFGYSDLGDAPEGAFADDSGNIKVVKASTYKVTLKSEKGSVKINIVEDVK